MFDIICVWKSVRRLWESQTGRSAEPGATHTTHYLVLLRPRNYPWPSCSSWTHSHFFADPFTILCYPKLPVISSLVHSLLNLFTVSLTLDFRPDVKKDQAGQTRWSIVLPQNYNITNWISDWPFTLMDCVASLLLKVSGICSQSFHLIIRTCLISPAPNHLEIIDKFCSKFVWTKCQHSANNCHIFANVSLHCTWVIGF